MTVVEWLDQLEQEARQNLQLKQALLETRAEKEPVSAFCRICRDKGYPIYEMDLVAAGEDFYAAMKRSTNGGGENSPTLEGEDDFYELFLSGLEQCEKTVK